MLELDSTMLTLEVNEKEQAPLRAVGMCFYKKGDLCHMNELFTQLK